MWRRLYCVAQQDSRSYACADHNRFHFRCRKYDSRRFPNSQNINLFLILVGDSRYEGLGLALRLLEVVRVNSLHHVRCGWCNADFKVNHQTGELLPIDKDDLCVNARGVVCCVCCVA